MNKQTNTVNTICDKRANQIKEKEENKKRLIVAKTEFIVHISVQIHEQNNDQK